MRLSCDVLPAIPFFIEGIAGKLFAIYHEPAGFTPDLGDVIYLPPFGDEINNSRHFTALMARELAKLGLGVLLIDLYGCGDSAGDFRDASCEIWKKDVSVGVEWLLNRGREHVSLWGLCFGSLLCLDFASESRHPFQRIVLCQPTL